MKIMATEYGRRLKQARTEAGLTQKELSSRTGIAQSTISTAEREGHGSADTPIYALACGVTALWLANGDGPKHPVDGYATGLIGSLAQIDPPKTKYEPATPVAMEIALLFDLIPVTDKIRRTQL